MMMDLFTNAIKGQFNSLNIVLFFVLAGSILWWRNRKRIGVVFIITGVAFFLLFSTAYLPRYLTSQLETQYLPFHFSEYPFAGDSTYIHVLGAGYTADEKLPASGQLSLFSLARLSEGLRIGTTLQGSILVVSGHIASGDSSLAWVYRNAAIELGFDSTRIDMLNKPATTLEEARAFLDRYGIKSRVIVVTDAIHMPRAITFYKHFGMNPFPAPTNFLIKSDNNPFSFGWIPSAENLLLMDRILREWAGLIKAKTIG